MYLHFTYFTQCCQAWHIHLQFKNIINTVHAVGPAIDVVRRHYGVNHLHELGRSLDYSSVSGFCTIVSVEILSRLAIFERLLLFESITVSAAPGVLPRICKGMQDRRRSRKRGIRRGLANAALYKYCLC